MTDIENALKNKESPPKCVKSWPIFKTRSRITTIIMSWSPSSKNSLPRTNNYSSSCCRHSCWQQDVNNNRHPERKARSSRSKLINRFRRKTRKPSLSGPIKKAITFSQYTGRRLDTQDFNGVRMFFCRRYSLFCWNTWLILLQTGRKSAEDSRLQAFYTRMWTVLTPECEWYRDPGVNGFILLCYWNKSCEEKYRTGS